MAQLFIGLYPLLTRGSVKEKGVDTLERVMLYDEAARLTIDVAVGSTFDFSGISLNRKYTIFFQ